MLPSAPEVSTADRIGSAGGGGLASAWQRHGGIIKWLGVVYLAVAAIGKLRYALPHLLRDVDPGSAWDLKYRFNEVAEWFAGNPVYGVVDGAVYPPASHAILWPLMGWVSLDTARLLWAISTLVAAVAIGWLAIRLTAPAPLRDRLLVAGLALAAYPIQISIFVGQMGVHVIALAACGAVLLLVERPRWGLDALAGLLLAASLVKPTLSLPLVVAALIAGRRTRPVLMLAIAYAALTLVAVAAQPAGLFVLLREWLAVAGERVPIMDGVPNIHMLLAWAGLREWMTPASLLVLVGMAWWMWRKRNADPVILLGVAALVARVWAHSTLYDDVLLLLAAVALFRIASRNAPGHSRTAGWLFAGAWAALLTPTWVFYGFDPLVVRALHGAQAVLWLAALGFLAVVASSSGEVALPLERAEPSPQDRHRSAPT
jgi:hypothetical protein